MSGTGIFGNYMQLKATFAVYPIEVGDQTMRKLGLLSSYSALCVPAAHAACTASGTSSNSRKRKRVRCASMPHCGNINNDADQHSTRNGQLDDADFVDGSDW